MQPSHVVGLCREGTSHGTYESRSCLFPLGRPVSRKTGRKKITVKYVSSRKYTNSLRFYLDPLDRRPISANPRLNFNPGFLFFVFVFVFAIFFKHFLG